jgi:hypothetical protein
MNPWNRERVKTIRSSDDGSVFVINERLVDFASLLSQRLHSPCGTQPFYGSIGKNSFESVQCGLRLPLRLSVEGLEQE